MSKGDIPLVSFTSCFESAIQFKKNSINQLNTTSTNQMSFIIEKQLYHSFWIILLFACNMQGSLINKISCMNVEAAVQKKLD